MDQSAQQEASESRRKTKKHKKHSRNRSDDHPKSPNISASNAMSKPVSPTSAATADTSSGTPKSHSMSATTKVPTLLQVLPSGLKHPPLRKVSSTTPLHDLNQAKHSPVMNESELSNKLGAVGTTQSSQRSLSVVASTTKPPPPPSTKTKPRTSVPENCTQSSNAFLQKLDVRSPLHPQPSSPRQRTVLQSSPNNRVTFSSNINVMSGSDNNSLSSTSSKTQSSVPTPTTAQLITPFVIPLTPTPTPTSTSTSIPTPTSTPNLTSTSTSTSTPTPTPTPNLTLAPTSTTTPTVTVPTTQSSSLSSLNTPTPQLLVSSQEPSRNESAPLSMPSSPNSSTSVSIPISNVPSNHKYPFTSTSTSKVSTPYITPPTVAPQPSPTASSPKKRTLIIRDQNNSKQSSNVRPLRPKRAQDDSFLNYGKTIRGLITGEIDSPFTFDADEEENQGNAVSQSPTNTMSAAVLSPNTSDTASTILKNQQHLDFPSDPNSPKIATISSPIAIQESSSLPKSSNAALTTEHPLSPSGHSRPAQTVELSENERMPPFNAQILTAEQVISITDINILRQSYVSLLQQYQELKLRLSALEVENTRLWRQQQFGSPLEFNELSLDLLRQIQENVSRAIALKHSS
jgi:hypothetical protein